MLLHKSHKEDIVDYLDGQHDAPLIVPGQAVQEFWNNQLSAVDTAAVKLRKSFNAFKTDAKKLVGKFNDTENRIGSLLEEFTATHGHVYEEVVLRDLISVVKMLEKRSRLSFVPRVRFQQIAHQRKRTNTPPGFRDDGDGDFFIWADFLYGLLTELEAGADFDRVILVTIDRKLDWSREGVAHPILVAEVDALLRKPFEIWDLNKFAKAVQEITSSESAKNKAGDV